MGSRKWERDTVGKIEDHLPWREELDLLDTRFIKGKTLTFPDRLEDAAGDYADELIDKDNIAPGQRDELITALKRAALFYNFGELANSEIPNNKKRAKA